MFASRTVVCKCWKFYLYIRKTLLEDLLKTLPLSLIQGLGGNVLKKISSKLVKTVSLNFGNFVEALCGTNLLSSIILVHNQHDKLHFKIQFYNSFESNYHNNKTVFVPVLTYYCYSKPTSSVNIALCCKCIFYFFLDAVLTQLYWYQ